MPHGETVRFELRCVGRLRRVVARARRLTPPSSQCLTYRPFDRLHVASTAELSNETAARPQGAVHAIEHGVVVAHPMQHRIRKHRVELLVKRQILRAHPPRIQPARGRRRDHLRRNVDPNDGGAGCRDPLGQRALAAPKIQDPLARQRVQQAATASPRADTCARRR